MLFTLSKLGKIVKLINKVLEKITPKYQILKSQVRSENVFCQNKNKTYIFSPKSEISENFGNLIMLCMFKKRGNHYF